MFFRHTHLSPRPIIFFSALFACFGGSFPSRAPVDGFLHTLALAERPSRQAHIPRARDVKPCFRLFRYVIPCVNARWSM